MARFWTKWFSRRRSVKSASIALPATFEDLQTEARAFERKRLAHYGRLREAAGRCRCTMHARATKAVNFYDKFSNHVVFDNFLLILPVMWFICGGVACLAQGISDTTFWWVFGLLALPGAAFISLNLARFFLWSPCAKMLEDAKPSVIVNAYLQKTIEDAEMDAIGAQSPIGQLRERLRVIADRATSFRDIFSGKVKARGNSAPQYLVRAHERAEALLARTKAALDRIEGYSSQVCAFFAACREQLRGIDEPLNDLEHLRDFTTLDCEADAEIGSVEEVIGMATARITGRLTEFRDRTEALYTDTGVRIAVSAASSGDIEQDIATIEDTIQRFTACAAQLPEPPDEETLLRAHALERVSV